jgi:hypothetical protein
MLSEITTPIQSIFFVRLWRIRERITALQTIEGQLKAVLPNLLRPLPASPADPPAI